MKKHEINIKYNDPKYASMQISADSIEELDAKLEQFLKVNESIYWNSSAENALGSRTIEALLEGEEALVQYAHSDMFSFEQVDNTAELEKLAQVEALEAEEKELLAKLAETDFYVIRKAETEVDYDQSIKDERAAARVRISEIREEKAAL